MADACAFDRWALDPKWEFTKVTLRFAGLTRTLPATRSRRGNHRDSAEITLRPLGLQIANTLKQARRGRWSERVRTTCAMFEETRLLQRLLDDTSQQETVTASSG